MKQRYCLNIIMCICLCCIASLGAWAQTASHAANRLYIPDIVSWRGNTSYLPVSMDNTHDVTAVQFNLAIPVAMQVAQQDAFLLTDRATDHVVQARHTKSDQTMNWYLVMIYSPTNAPFVGRTGKILDVKFVMSDRAAEGDRLMPEITSGVMSSADKKNVCGEVNNGCVSVEHGPDLIIPSLSFSEEQIAPGGTLNLSWTVQNIGTEAVDKGWSEEISVVEKSTTAANYTKSIVRHIETVHHDGSLEADATVSRNTTLHLPTLLGIDGECRVMVRIVPYPESNERPESRGNNVGVSQQVVRVDKNLMLTLNQTSVAEKRTTRLYATLSRSGRWDKSETFQIEVTGDSRVSAPATVTIPTDQSAARFAIDIADNDQLDPLGSVASIKVSDSAASNAYAAVSTALTVTDDEVPTLSLSTAKQVVEEGETIALTIAVDRAPATDLPIQITSNHAHRLVIPSGVVIPAGKTSVAISLQTNDNDEPNTEEDVTVYAMAADHKAGETWFVLTDNDIPLLEMVITPDAVSESAGPLALTATLHRIDKLDRVVTVRFSDDSDGNIYYDTRTVKFEKGEEYATIKLGPVDNANADGERTYNISAAVYIASCSCNASPGAREGTVSVPVTVYDNDGPALTLVSTTSVLKEGGETTLTVSRNTGTAQPLTVRISCEQDGMEVPGEVVIPAGAASVSFTVKSVANDLSDESYIATITAEADQYSKANVWLTVSDVNKPDAQVTAISLSKSEEAAGGKVDVTFTITNTGSAPLPELTKTSIYISGQREAKASHYLQSPLAAGMSITATKTVELPAEIGAYSLYAVANADNAVNELSQTNNTSAAVGIRTVSPFTVDVRTDKATYLQGEEIKITGSVAGPAAEGQPIEVYVINDGYRHVVSSQIDSEGRFEAAYTPFGTQMGEFTVGACYPGEGLKEPVASFDLYGIRRTDSTPIKFYPHVGETYRGTFAITNPGKHAVSGLKVTVASKPDNCTVDVSCPSTIPAGQSVVVSYSLTSADASTGEAWEKALLDFTSNEGATLKTTLYYYTKYAEAHLKSSISSINATMHTGHTREYPITITNEGKGETGKITLSLPAWMKAATPMEMSSLAPGESAEVMLLFTPNDNMQVNVPVTGVLGFNCENGKGLSISYIVEPVSDAQGTLLVDVCDEFTYYTTEAPHVAGAKVKVSHPYTGAEIAAGETDAEGHYTATLPEGYYRLHVTADKHETYDNYICINAGRVEKVNVTICYEPITISWDVVETEVEDEYKVVATTQYETRVPAPIVKVSLPDRIDGDNMAVGDFTIIYMTLTNVGLIRAENVDLLMPEDNSEFKFEPLDYNYLFSLAPQQAVVVPIRVTRVSDGNQGTAKVRHKASFGDTWAHTSLNCIHSLGALYQDICGSHIKTNKAMHALSAKYCNYAGVVEGVRSFLASTSHSYSGTGNQGVVGKGGGGSNPTKDDKYNPVTATDNNNSVKQNYDLCDPVYASRLKTLINQSMRGTPFYPLDRIVNFAIQALQRNGNYNTKSGLDKIRNDILDNCTYLGGLNASVSDLNDFLEIGNEGTSSKVRDMRRARSLQDKSFDAVAVKMRDQLVSLDKIMLMLFGDRVWYENMDTEKVDYMIYVRDLPSGFMPSNEEIRMHKPEAVSLDQAKAYINYSRGLSPNYPTYEVLKAETDTYMSFNKEAKESGHSSMLEMYDNAYTSYKAYLEDMKESSVCASISLQFSQTMTMTRQAFRGTLTVFNGHETTAMQNVRLNLEVKNLQTGLAATSYEFEIDAETLNGFEGPLDLTSGWTLGANETGVATVIFIPTKNAAPIEAQNYSFGGSLVYTDPFTGLEVTRQLHPVTLMVNPSPVLDITYFMQRDVMGDDPLTEAVEPSEEAEFSVLIRNKGYGDATNVRMMTMQPKIVDNQKNLLVDFELVSSQLRGEDKTLALGGSVATNFGTIPAMSSTYAQWKFRSSLLGHFNDYDVQATHVSSYGNDNLSLLDQVTIHELIRSVDNGGTIAFLTNDTQDNQTTPDMLYLENGDVENVACVTAAYAEKKSDTVLEITITPSFPGWNYGNVADPTYGVAALKSVVRKSDGKELSLRNVWQTDRTLRNGSDPLYENRIHLLDNLADVQPVTYVLTFEATPRIQLEVQSMKGMPEDGSLVLEPVPYVDVIFNKAIAPETFTIDDIALTIQGEKQDVSLVTVSTEDNRTFRLDFSAANEVLPNGYYNLSIHTTGITDYEGFQGKSGRNAGWVMFREGQIILRRRIMPIFSGTIQIASLPESASVPQNRMPQRRIADDDDEHAEYGSKLMLTAVPEEGYQFVNWSLNGEVVSTEPTFEYTALCDMNLVANFRKKKYKVELEDCENGALTDVRGYYEHGEELTLTAQPDQLYALDHWIVNGEDMDGGTELTLMIDKPYVISACFSRDLYEQHIKLSKGWNWLSTYLSEPISIWNFAAFSERILGQYDEVIRDPEFGLVGGFDSLESGKGYKLMATGELVADLKGHLGKSTLSVSRGWNWIAYPLADATPLAEALPQADQGDFLLSQYGFSEYWDGAWEGTLGTLVPGAGYIYKSVNRKDLQFHAGLTDVVHPVMRTNAKLRTPHDVSLISCKYPSTMNVTAVLCQGETPVDDEVYTIFAMAGDECRGIGERVGDNYYITVYGDESTEITFVAQSSLTGESFAVDEKLKFTEDVIGSRKSPLRLTIDATTGLDRIQNGLDTCCIYSVAGVLLHAKADASTLRHLPAGIYIIGGQKYVVK